VRPSVIVASVGPQSSVNKKEIVLDMHVSALVVLNVACCQSRHVQIFGDQALYAFEKLRRQLSNFIIWCGVDDEMGVGEARHTELCRFALRFSSLQVSVRLLT